MEVSLINFFRMMGALEPALIMERALQQKSVLRLVEQIPGHALKAMGSVVLVSLRNVFESDPDVQFGNM